MLFHLLMIVPLALLLYLPGWATLLVLGQRQREGAPRDALGLLFLQFGMGIAIGGGIALVLALAGRFSGFHWSIASLLWTLAALALARPRLAEIRRTLPLSLSAFKQDLAIVVILLLALAIFLMPFMNVFGMSDEGAYPNIAGHIEKTGSVSGTDTVMRDMEPGLRPLFYYTEDADPIIRNIQEPGYFVTDFNKGAVLPQFIFFYPALMAVFMAFLGIRPAFGILPLFAVFSVLGLYLVGRELAGRIVGLVAALLISVTFLQVYFSKYSTAEMATQLFFLYGLFALLKYKDAAADKDSAPSLWAYGIAAATGFTAMMLSHIESFFFLAPLILTVSFWFVQGGRRALWNTRHFLISISAGIAVALFVAFEFSNRYTEVVMRATVRKLPGGWLAIVGGMVALVIAAVLLRWPLGGVRRFLFSKKKWILSLAALALVVVTAYAWFVRPALVVVRATNPQSSLNSSNLSRLVYYLTPLGVVLAVAGYCLFITRRLDGRNLIVPACGLFFSAMFLYRTLANPQLVYSMRRFVPVAVPVAFLIIGYLSAEMGNLARGRLRPALKTASVALVMALLIWSAALSVRVFKISQTRASFGVVHQVSDLAAEPSIIVCDQRAAHLLAAPLRNFFGRDVAGIRRNKNQLSPKFDVFLRSLRGKVVYYVASNSDVSKLARRFRLEAVETVEFKGVMLKTAIEKPTTETLLFIDHLFVYRVMI